MCQCASCTPTDKLHAAGFAAWPRGNPAGRKSASEYSAHVAFSRQWGRMQNGNMHHAPEFPAGYWQRSPFPCTGTRRIDAGADRSYPTLADAKMGAAHYVAAFLSANQYATDEKERAKAAYASMVKHQERAAAKREKASPTYARPARPAQPGKAEPHFPAGDRPSETAKIYAMPKAQPKRSVGRPAMPGSRVVIKLPDELKSKAEALGDGNLSEGIRKALELASPPAKRSAQR